MKLTPQEAGWLDRWFHDHHKGLPSSRSYEPHYDATSYSCQYCLDSLREAALRFPTEVSSVVSALTTGQKWPRLKMRDAFWMQARWYSAQGHCMWLSGRTEGSPSEPILPKSASAAIGWLLQEAWRSQFADEWLRENARWHIFVDDPSIQESITDLEIFLRKLEGKL